MVYPRINLGLTLTACVLLIIGCGGRGGGDGAIKVSGNIEATETELSFKLPGRLLARLVEEGGTVSIGQVIARLDPADLEREVNMRRADAQAVEATLAELEAGSRPEEIAQAEAAMERAKAVLADLQNGARSQEIASAEAAVQSAQADVAKVLADFSRVEALFQKKVMAKRDYDAAWAAKEMAQARLKDAMERLDLVREGYRKDQIAQAQAAFNEGRQRYTLVKKGPRQETIRSARARLVQAKEALALAENRLGDATLSSPVNGVVLSKNVEPGEYVSPGMPVVTVADLKEVWLRAFVNETDLGRVKVGQKVRVWADTWPGKVYEGHIMFIAAEAEFTPKIVQTEQDRVKLVYRIKVGIANPAQELKPGMPADAEILTR